MSCPAGYSLSDLYRPAGSFISDNLQVGQRVASWNFLVTWTERHIRARDLEPYRMQGDPLSDETLRVLNVKRHEDALEALMAYVQRPVEQQESDIPRKFLDHVLSVPDWVDWDQLRRGQQVFWKYVLYISIGLVHFSLTGVHNAPKFAKVMTSTGYLTGSRSTARITETAQFVFDMMRSVEDLRPGSGYAWKSIVRIRLLHSQVRIRLTRLSKAHSSKYYSVEQHGVPINQEDMASTVFFLSTAMWQMMDQRLGIVMTLQEREDFLHLWRLTGFYMGVDPKWDPARDALSSDAVYESILMHTSDPTELGGAKASKMLYNLTSVMPIPHALHLAISEKLLGQDMWLLMGQTPANWRNRLVRWMIFGSFYLDQITLSQSQWFCDKRADVVRWGLDWMIRKELGDRSNYAYQHDPSLEHQDAVLVEGDDYVKGSKSRSWWSTLALLGAVSVGVAVVKYASARIMVL
ncbi:hypothetical protein BGZ73_003168 [Actinomortierella ambigua]|nr:hypothetical protein BGZ73_003168 [Actinomortierella ambigua]